MQEIKLNELKQLPFWEVILPFRGQLRYGGDLPLYFEQGNCNILPNKKGILIVNHVFLDFINRTTILKDFDKFYIFINPDQSENQERYQQDYLDDANIQADFLLFNPNAQEELNT